MAAFLIPFLLPAAITLSTLVGVGGGIYMMHNQREAQKEALASQERMQAQQAEQMKPVLQGYSEYNNRYQADVSRALGLAQGQNYPTLPGQNWGAGAASGMPNMGNMGNGNGNPPWVMIMVPASMAQNLMGQLGVQGGGSGGGGGCRG